MKEENTQKTSLVDKLVALHDEFVEFNDYCAFLCDSIPYLYNESKESEPDEQTIMGAKRHCSWVKSKAEVLNSELDNICQQLKTNEQTTSH